MAPVTVPISVARAEELLADAVAVRERLYAALTAGSRDVTADALAQANDRVEFETARLEAAKDHEKQVRNPERLGKIKAVLDGFHRDRFPKQAARVLELHAAARAAMAELTPVLAALRGDARAAMAELRGLRPLTEDTAGEVDELERIIRLADALAKDAQAADVVLRADRQIAGGRIEVLRGAVQGGQLRPKPRPKIAIIDLGAGSAVPRQRVVEARVAHRLVEQGRARYVNPADDPRPKPDMEVADHG